MQHTGMATTPSARLFTGLWPDDALRAAIVAQRERWTLSNSAQCVRPERLHMTLHFIGDVARDRVEALRAALRDVPVEPMDFVLDASALWRRDVASLRPRRVPAALPRLHEAVGAALVAQGIEIERREWRPHVTLARRAGDATAPPEPFSLRWRPDGFVLVESELRPPARYVVLEHYSRTSATGLVPKSGRSR